jgi:membrane associated rhomboid family serine protease
MNIINDIHQSYKKGDLLSKLIYLNLFVFLFYKVLTTLFFLFSVQNTSIISWFALSSNFNDLLTKPWTIISHMFYHQGFIHLAFNLIGLYFYGKIFSQYLNSKQLVSTYVIGGLFGALFYYLSFNYLEAFESDSKSFAFGASAAVLAILTSIATYTPNYRVTIPLVATFELKYVALVFIFLDIMLIPSSNGGGHIAHLGGAFYGFYFGHRLKQGKDISIWFNNLMNSISNYSRKDLNLKTVHKRAKTDDQWRNEKKQSQVQINLILEKISKSGYESLNDKEKEILFKESKK